ncbi:replication/maintenance protein RepL [Paenibacillus thiaminolyticus]
MLELLGGKKIKVVNYFLKCAEENDGYIFGSLRKISEDTGVAYSTVVETVKNFRIPD